MLKEYILILDWVDVGHAINSAAHSSLIAHEKWKEDHVYQNWFKNSFRKVTCKVTEKEFEKAKTYEDYVIVTESSLGNQQVALVFKPREEWSKFFKHLKLYK